MAGWQSLYKWRFISRKIIYKCGIFRQTMFDYWGKNSNFSSQIVIDCLIHHYSWSYTPLSLLQKNPIAGTGKKSESTAGIGLRLAGSQRFLAAGGWRRWWAQGSPKANCDEYLRTNGIYDDDKHFQSFTMIVRICLVLAHIFFCVFYTIFGMMGAPRTPFGCFPTMNFKASNSQRFERILTGGCQPFWWFNMVFHHEFWWF